jgi:hypothetical protein
MDPSYPTFKQPTREQQKRGTKLFLFYSNIIVLPFYSFVVAFAATQRSG